MSIDTQEQISNERVTFADITRASRIDEVNPGYGIGSIFGEYVRHEPDITALSDGLWTAWHVLLDDLHVGGSAVSVAQIPEAAQNLGYDSPLLRALLPISSSGLFSQYYEGAMNVKSMSSEAYVFLKILQSLRGSNLDIFGYEQRGNLEDSLNKAATLARLGSTYPYDGVRRGISVVDYFGRFKSIHLAQGDTEGGGLNIMCLPQSLQNQDKWTNATTLRQLQTQIVSRTADGILTIPGEASFHTNEPIRMVETWDTIGQWLHMSARSIRTAVIHQMPGHRMDKKSFLDKIPSDKTIDFESAIGIAANLFVAWYHDPEGTMQLIQDLDISTYLPNFSTDVLEKYYQQIKTENLVTPQDAMNIFLQAGSNAQKDLFDREKLDTHPVQSNDFQFTSLDQLATLVEPFLPMSSSQFLSLCPGSSKRESISWKLAGNEVWGFHKDYSVFTDAIEMFWELAQELKAKGDPESDKKADTLLTAAEALHQLFLKPELEEVTA